MVKIQPSNNTVTMIIYAYLHQASHACPSRSCHYDHPILREVILYLLEIGRFSYDMTLKRPSLMAAAAVYLARATLGIKEGCGTGTTATCFDGTGGFWTPTLQHYTGYTIEELRDPVLHIYRYQLLAGESEHLQGEWRML